MAFAKGTTGGHKQNDALSKIKDRKFAQNVALQKDGPAMYQEVERRHVMALQPNLNAAAEISEINESQPIDPIHDILQGVKDTETKIRQADAETWSEKKRADILDPEQQWVVVNLAHRQQRPVKEYPGFRIMGFFATREAAVKYVHKATKRLPNCHMWVVPVGRHITVCRSTELQTHGVYGKVKAELMVRKYVEDHESHKKEFKQNYEEKKAGKTGLSFEKVRKAQIQKRRAKTKSSRKQALKHAQAKNEQMAAALNQSVLLAQSAQSVQSVQSGSQISQSQNVAYPNVSSSKPDEQQYGAVLNALSKPKCFYESGDDMDMPSQLLRRKQEYVVVTILRDVSKKVLSGDQEPEPVIAFWRAFATYDMAQEWMDQVAKYIPTMHMYVVDMYEWLYPENVDLDKLAEKHRNSEKHRIMMAQKEEKEKVADFQAWHDEQKLPMNVTEVVAYRPRQPDEQDLSNSDLDENAFDSEDESGRESNRQVQIIKAIAPGETYQPVSLPTAKIQISGSSVKTDAETIDQAPWQSIQVFTDPKDAQDYGQEVRQKRKQQQAENAVVEELVFPASSKSQIKC